MGSGFGRVGVRTVPRGKYLPDWDQWDYCGVCQFLTRPSMMWERKDGTVVPLCDECEEGLHGEG